MLPLQRRPYATPTNHLKKEIEMHDVAYAPNRLADALGKLLEEAPVYQAAAAQALESDDAWLRAVDRASEDVSLEEPLDPPAGQIERMTVLTHPEAALVAALDAAVDAVPAVDPYVQALSGRQSGWWARRAKARLVSLRSDLVLLGSEFLYRRESPAVGWSIRPIWAQWLRRLGAWQRRLLRIGAAGIPLAPIFPPHRLAAALEVATQKAEDYERAVERVRKLPTPPPATQDHGPLDPVADRLARAWGQLQDAHASILRALDAATGVLKEVDVWDRTVQESKLDLQYDRLMRDLAELRGQIHDEAVIAFDGDEVRPDWLCRMNALRAHAQRLRHLNERHRAPGPRQQSPGTQVRTEPGLPGTPEPDPPSAVLRCVSYTEVRKELLAMVDAGEPYTSIGDLATRYRCAKSTINKAIQASPTLKRWQKLSLRERRRKLRAQSLNEVVADSTAAAGPDPSDTVAEVETDAELRRLLQDVPPEERARLNAMRRKDLREMARLYEAQRRDQHIQDHARQGNRVLDRRP